MTAMEMIRDRSAQLARQVEAAHEMQLAGEGSSTSLELDRILDEQRFLLAVTREAQPGRSVAGRLSGGMAVRIAQAVERRGAGVLMEIDLKLDVEGINPEAKETSDFLSVPLNGSASPTAFSARSPSSPTSR